MSVVTVKPYSIPGKPLPVGRFTTDATVRMDNREQTASGVVPGDGLMVQSSDGNDFILLESDIGTGTGYLELEN